MNEYDQSKDRIHREHIPVDVHIVDLGVPSMDKQVREAIEDKNTFDYDGYFDHMVGREMSASEWAELRRETAFNAARRERKDREVRERMGLACPTCLYRENPRHPLLTVVCNTWPRDGAKFLQLGICFCGHPWLKDAEKNHLNFLFHGEDHAGDYPTIEKWLWETA